MEHKRPRSPKPGGRKPANKKEQLKLRARLDADYGPSPLVDTIPRAGQVGRPKKDIDRRVIAALAAIHCTYEEMAAVCGVGPDLLRDNPEITAIVDNERTIGKMSLRRAQWRVALNGSTGMLIWLGKLYLGQNPTSGDVPPVPGDPNGALIATDARDILLRRLDELEDRERQIVTHGIQHTEM